MRDGFQSEKLLKGKLLPDCMIELLSIYGYNLLEDIAEIDEESINDIEIQVRRGNFNGLIDIDSKSTRLKYFGSETLIHSQFSIAKITRKKVLSAAAAAFETIGQVEVPAAALSPK